MKSHPVVRSRTLHAIAVMEAVKGIAVLAASIGLLSLVHSDIRHHVHEMVKHFAMNPNAHFPPILLHYADVLEDTNLRSLVLLASGYAMIRLLEAYGLWRDLAWGEWLGALSSGIYIPFEVRHFILKPSLIAAVLIVTNAFIVGYLGVRLYRRRSASGD
jgi:uncharacterized membrane protein (DUF2068 family)